MTASMPLPVSGTRRSGSGTASRTRPRRRRGNERLGASAAQHDRLSTPRGRLVRKAPPPYLGRTGGRGGASRPPKSPVDGSRLGR